MIRRARLSFKPNVRPGGRAAAPGSAGSARDGGVAPAAEPVLEPGKETKTAGPGEASTAPLSGGPGEAQPLEESNAEPIDAAAPVGNEVAPSKTAPAPLQRRKRISTLPNLAKPRVSNSASAGVPPPKPSQVDTPSTPPIIPAPCKIEGPSPEKGKVQSPQKSPVPVSTPQGQHVTLPEKRTPVPQVPQFSAYKKSVLKQQEVSPAKAVDCAQTEEPSPLKERPSQKSCSNEVFEVIKKTTAKKITAGNLEKERLKRAQKLRDLLRAELRKERKARKAKHPVINPTVEPEKSKMTMRDFIHFIPLTNPMSSSLEESKSSEKSFPVESQPTGIVGKNGSEEDDLDDDDEEDDSQLLAPRVKVAEDGSIILDEESLTVEVSRNKAPIVEGNDPIFERGSTTTYSSFRKNNYSKPWSEPETDMFFLAISMVGTDFSMIGQLFPHRERIEIKNKFKKEERVNGWRIDKAFREKKEFDFEFFAELLEKALEAGNKRKARSKQPRKTNAKSRKKQKDKTAAEQSLCDEESVLSEEEGADARTAEKENKRSLEDDECSGVADPVPVKKKRSKRKKDNAKEPEEEHRESQDDDSTQKPKKKPRKRKTTALDTDDKPELPSLDNDGSLKETPAVKKGVQEHKPNYKESEVEDDENDADFVISEDIGDDVHMSCKAGEAEPATEMSDPTCDEESSLILFSEQSDYQSGLDDLSGLQHSLSELNEAVSQASDVGLVAPNFMLGETEPINVTQEETSMSACDEVDGSDKASDAGSGQPGDQDSESKPKQKMPEGHRARPAPNLSKAAAKKKVPTEEKSDDTQQALTSDDIDIGKNDRKVVQEEALSVDQPTVEAAKAADSSNSPDGTKESSVKTTIPGRGRLQRPKPNLPARSSNRREKLLTDSKVIPVEEAEKGADVLAQSKTDDAENLNRGEVDVSPIGDEHGQEGSLTVQKDASSESDPSQTKESKLDEQDCDKEDTGKEKPSPLVRGRLRPKPNLTRASVKNKSSDMEQEIQPSQASHLNNKSPSPPSRDEKNEAKERVEPSSVSQDECRKSPIKPVPLARGRFQRPKPNLTKASSRKEAFDAKEDSSAPSAGLDAGGDLQSDNRFEKQENEMLISTGSESSQGSCKSEMNLHHSSSLQLIQDSTVNQDHLHEEPSISVTQSTESPVKPAPVARGRLQKPKPNLLRASGRKGEFEMNKSESLEAVTAEKRSATELVKEVISVEQESSSEKSSSVMPQKVDGKTLTEEPNTPLKPAVLPKDQFQRPKPNLCRAAAKPDDLPSPDEPENIPQGEASVESAVETKDATSNIPINDVEIAPLHAKRDGHSLALEKVDNGSSHGTSVDSAQATTDKEQSASDDERKTSKPVLTRSMLRRPKPNLSKSTKRSAVTAPLVSAVQEENKKTATTSADNNDLHVSLDVEASNGKTEVKSAVTDTCDRAVAQPEESTNITKRGEASSLNPVRTRFTKPSPNIGRAVMRKETSTTDLKTLVPKKGQEPLKEVDDNPEPLKIEDVPNTSIAGLGCKEDGHAIEEKSAAIKPAQLKRGRPIRPVPNLVKPSAKASSPLQNKPIEALSGAPTVKNKDCVVATSSPANKRKALDTNSDLSPKRICPAGTPQKSARLSDSEGDKDPMSEPSSSSHPSSVQDTDTQRSRFGRPLRRLSAAPSASPKSETSSDRPEKEKPVRSVKSNATKVSKLVSSKSKGKTTLVKLRATQQQEEDEEDADLGSDEENYDLSPDMQNQAPVFVPFSLRSPRPVTAEIEETLEELEIPVDAVDLPTSTNQDSARTPLQHVTDPEAQLAKRGEFLSSDPSTDSMGGQENEEQLTRLKLLCSPTRSLLSSPQHDSSVTVDPRMVDPHRDPNVGNKPQTSPVISSGFGSADNLPAPIDDTLAFPIEQMSYPVMQGNARQEGFSSQDVRVSDCLVGEHGTGEEATFILTLVEIPINDSYGYSCDSNMAERLPAPVLISSGSCQALTQNLNPSTETVSCKPCVVGQEDKDLMLDQTSIPKNTKCTDEGDHASPQKQHHASEQVVNNLQAKLTAVEVDGDAPEVSATEPRESVGVSLIGGTAVRERPSNRPAAKTCGTVPVEMPGMSTADSSTRNLPLVCAHPAATSKMPLKRPGKKPLGFLSLVCKEKQLKKANEEKQKKKTLPRLTSRKISPTVQGRHKESPDLNLETAKDNEVPSSSIMYSLAEVQSTTPEKVEDLPSTSKITDDQEPDLQAPSKSHDLSTEEEAAPVSEYFFSDIFMEVDD
ncbi:transcription factor TFIIIB component B'' homolog isoform X2 [Eleutherodactylus coqui]|uniref:transcription factor TFIIIB component B'' homolog isoform X2 n=1 Tax=Eleutherodactylus coqui TaxID=57060 RepID=UPI003462B506